MIRTKQDLVYYLEADRRSLGMTRRRPGLFGYDIWKYQRVLRRYAYYYNRSGLLRYKVSPMKHIYHYLLYRKGRTMGFSIGINAFGPGLCIGHQGTIVVNGTARIGENCRLHVCVNIGNSPDYTDNVPTIGNNVYIGPGAKIFGKIHIADNIAIGANSVVNRSFETPNVSIAGVPAREISKKGSEGMLIRGTEMAGRPPGDINIKDCLT
jgi:serine O-acetyltransferase